MPCLSLLPSLTYNYICMVLTDELKDSVNSPDCISNQDLPKAWAALTEVHELPQHHPGEPEAALHLWGHCLLVQCGLVKLTSWACWGFPRWPLLTVTAFHRPAIYINNTITFSLRRKALDQWFLLDYHIHSSQAIRHRRWLIFRNKLFAHTRGCPAPELHPSSLAVRASCWDSLKSKQICLNSPLF